MKNVIKVSALATAVLMLASMGAYAATTSSGTLTVTATIEPSISLVFDSNSSGVTLTNAATNAATLDFGDVSATGATNTAVTVTASSTGFTFSTPFDVHVTEYNSTSASYSLTAELASADTVNTWALSSTAISSSAATSVATAGAYGTDYALTLAITAPASNTTGTISNVIDFVATAN